MKKSNPKHETVLKLAATVVALGSAIGVSADALAAIYAKQPDTGTIQQKGNAATQHKTDAAPGAAQYKEHMRARQDKWRTAPSANQIKIAPSAQQIKMERK